MRLTFDAQGAYQPVWMNDGTTVAYTRRNGERLSEVVMRAADGTGGTERLLANEGSGYMLSRDEEVVTVCKSFTECNLGIRAHDEVSGVKMLLRTVGIAVYPVLSPDHRWMAYLSVETGAGDVHVRPFPDVQAGHWIVSGDLGGGYPYWTPNGREILYRRIMDNKMIAVPVQTTPSFIAGQPQELFDATPYVVTPLTLKTHDITSDGQRFVMIKPAIDEELKVVLMQNFFDELERLAPTE